MNMRTGIYTHTLIHRCVHAFTCAPLQLAAIRARARGRRRRSQQPWAMGGGLAGGRSSRLCPTSPTSPSRASSASTSSARRPSFVGRRSLSVGRCRRRRHLRPHRRRRRRRRRSQVERRRGSHRHRTQSMGVRVGGSWSGRGVGFGITVGFAACSRLERLDPSARRGNGELAPLGGRIPTHLASTAALIEGGGEWSHSEFGDSERGRARAPHRVDGVCGHRCLEGCVPASVLSAPSTPAAAKRAKLTAI